MNKLFLLIPAALLLSACDKPSAPAAFTPEMASFSNEFEFDPLRGPVKTFTQILFDDQGEMVKRVRAQVS
ncbi:YnfC family lipoprotein, partial [Klebsiella aerogenes]